MRRVLTRALVASLLSSPAVARATVVCGPNGIELTSYVTGFLEGLALVGGTLGLTTGKNRPAWRRAAQWIAGAVLGVSTLVLIAD
ncbi:MAG: hypothetical protein L0206_11705, partial [Actinobacteria bacterium]|nr:hypothetical protein [Actinomycetota bacterium]